ncbi:ABC transporter permease [Sporomusa malonica]|uniref:ABC-type transport system involved in multi-copper enzyme maturation, permease component n=1 Tax=Sporomusa malonica TaxID=112901 RepID=A0A1W2F1M4_9FIRM|nr:ABC transporter permease [Sporomusa malonica]SMD15835.1 ABC-type transport system involved in multi-copper enzyme maturation, permease component [Sporomusa malonica]
MSQLSQLIIAEIRICLKSKTHWLIGLLAIVAVFIPALMFLIILILMINVLNRDEQSGFANILRSLPLPTEKLILARMLAVFFILLGLWPFMVIVVGVLLETQPAEWLFNSNDLLFLTLKYVTTCITIICFTFFLNLLTGYSAWLYFLAGFCWISTRILVNNLADFPGLGKLFFISHAVMLPSWPSVVLGYFPHQELMPAFALFMVAIAILFLLAAATWQMKKRGEAVWQSKLVIPLLILAVTGSVFAGGLILRELDNREKDFHSAFQETARRQPFNYLPGSIPVLENYHLQLKMKSQSHRLEGLATLQLKLGANSAEEVCFTLRNYFIVQKVILADSGQEINWRQEGSRLLIRIPSDYQDRKSLSLAISYSGQVWEWFNGRLARPTGPVNLVSPSFSLLRSGYAWYPIPGDHLLYQLQEYSSFKNDSLETTLWAKYAGHIAVPFTMTVDIDSDNMVASNLDQVENEPLTGDYKRRYHFASDSGRDVFLVTGPYQREKRDFPGREGFVEVYFYPQHQRQIDRVLHALAEPYRFYEELLQPASFDRPIAGHQDKLLTVIEMPTFFSYSETGESSRILTLTNSVLFSENYFRTGKHLFAFLDDIQANKGDLAVLQRWWQEDITRMYGWDRDGNISESIMLYLHTLYNEKKHGPAYYAQVKENLLAAVSTSNGEGDFTRPSLIGGSVAKDVFMILDTIRNFQFGNTAIRDVICSLYTVYCSQKEIQPDEFANIIERILIKHDCPQEKRAEIYRRLDNITRRANDPNAWRLKTNLSITIFSFNIEEWLP